jgi:hypothetical protein
MSHDPQYGSTNILHNIQNVELKNIYIHGRNGHPHSEGRECTYIMNRYTIKHPYLLTKKAMNR